MLATRYEGQLAFLRANETRAPLVWAAASAAFGRTPVWCCDQAGQCPAMSSASALWETLVQIWCHF